MRTVSTLLCCVSEECLAELNSELSSFERNKLELDNRIAQWFANRIDASDNISEWGRRSNSSSRSNREFTERRIRQTVRRQQLERREE